MDAKKQLRWDRHFLDLALAHAKMSKDPSTQVGAVIVGPDLEIRSVGYNGFPRGVEENDDRLNFRALKYKLTVHAERNAVLAAARVGTPLKGCSIYVVTRGRDGTFWGGPPCVGCLIELHQAGIVEAIGQPKKFVGAKWGDEEFPGLAEIILEETGIKYREVI